MTNKPGVLIWLRLVIGENDIMTEHVRDMLNVGLVENSFLQLHTFVYSVPSRVEMESTHYWRFFILKVRSYSFMRFPLKMLVHESTCHKFIWKSDPLVCPFKTTQERRFVDDVFVSVFPSCSKVSVLKTSLAS